ncbi:U-box domain-containing protein 5-like [Humulus lupulus]|uniref:U-box domain-containing protein 5-like n=1 Tax=Humulus lupulus TaxID=3486 RepID=UPI002B40C39B|nr:U-box domain-containing protein 5-like [Humulus lupulus]
MGTDVVEAAGAATKISSSFKVHCLMCLKLKALVDRISNIKPKIEDARPRCSTGIRALCTLSQTIEKAKLILEYCSNSSKLYLAVTGDVILSRCKKSKNLFEQSLSQIQDMVPVLLSAEISQIVDNLAAETFDLDHCEEEAGKVLRELIHGGTSSSDSMETSETRALQLAASRLHIFSAKDILLEKRAIQKLLHRVSETDSTKKKILTYFLYLFKKYGNLIIPDQTETASACCRSSFQLESSGNGFASNRSAEVKPRSRHRLHELENNMMMRAVPPEEFRCPISSRLMYDPVVIASGQSYERMWIQKWFDEGNDTCPKTGTKLTHLSLTSNVSMKDLISRWCSQNGVNLTDPSAAPEALHSLEFSSTSIASFSSSMNDIRLQMDFSNVSLGSIDTSFSSDSSRNKTTNGLNSAQIDDGSGKFQSCTKNTEPELEFLSNLGELSWDSRCKVVEEVKRHLKRNEKTYYSLSNENFVEPLVAFLRDAHDSNDVNALKNGLQLLLTFVNKNRNEVLYLREDAFGLLSSFLDSVVAEEVFTIMEVLSSYPYCRSKILASGALKSIIRALNSQLRDLQENAVKVLCNLSANNDICSHIASFECIPKLVSLLTDKALVEKCLLIMKNLCNTEEARTSVAETSGCIASISEVLENGSSEEQEHAVDILLSLCSQRIEYCEMVMEEGVIPPLVNISINGNDRGRVNALELLRQLRDVSSEPECPTFDLDANRESYHITEKKPSKTSAFFGRITRFSKNNGKRK